MDLDKVLNKLRFELFYPSLIINESCIHFRFNTYVMNETAAHYSVVSDIVKKAWPVQSSDVSKLYTIHYTLYTIHYTIYNIQYKL